jgi:hypothetical protein
VAIWVHVLLISMTLSQPFWWSVEPVLILTSLWGIDSHSIGHISMWNQCQCFSCRGSLAYWIPVEYSVGFYSPNGELDMLILASVPFLEHSCPGIACKAISSFPIFPAYLNFVLQGSSQVLSSPTIKGKTFVYRCCIILNSVCHPLKLFPCRGASFTLFGKSGLL